MGATVVMASRDPQQLELARARMARRERTIAVACDVTQTEDLRRLVELVLERFGRIDLLVNNAGYGLVDAVETMDAAACRAMFETNLFGALAAMQAVIPVMKKQGSGMIVNICSVAGHIAVPYMSAYGATKSSLIWFSRAARLELRGTGVHVCALCPGYVNTEFNQHAVRGRQDRTVDSSLKMGITPERVARAVVRAWKGRRREMIVPWHNWPVVWLSRLWPGLFEWAMMRAIGASGKRP
jgi:short-subunit dehydrogenase